jgi:transposase
LTNRRKSAQAIALRARIVLRCAAGSTNRETARHLRVSEATVAKWRRRFIERRLDGLFDEDRPGAKRTVTDDQVERVIVKTLEEKPADATHWSTRSMAKAMGMSQTSISLIWPAFGLQPHRAESFKLSTDPLFIEKVRDIVGLYLDPPERAVVLCVDEKSQIQALNRFQPILPMMPGTPERRSHDYVRHGTTSLFAALNTATGKVIGSMHRRHRAAEFKKFLVRIEEEVPDDLDVHLIGQLQHPQDARDQTMVGAPSSLPPALHADIRVVVEHGRAVVRGIDDQEDQARSPHQRPQPRARHPGVDRALERRPPSVRMGQDRRPDPGLPRPLLRADIGRRSTSTMKRTPSNNEF